MISAAIIYIEHDFDLSPLMQGWVVSSLIVGAMIGAAFAGKISDAVGRWWVLFVTAVIFTVGPFGLAFAPDASVLVIFRFVLGLSVGAAAVTHECRCRDGPEPPVLAGHRPVAAVERLGDLVLHAAAKDTRINEQYQRVYGVLDDRHTRVPADEGPTFLGGSYTLSRLAGEPQLGVRRRGTRP